MIYFIKHVIYYNKKNLVQAIKEGIHLSIEIILSA